MNVVLVGGMMNGREFTLPEDASQIEIEIPTQPVWSVPGGGLNLRITLTYWSTGEVLPDGRMVFGASRSKPFEG